MHPVIQTCTPRIYTKNLGNLVPREKISKQITHLTPTNALHHNAWNKQCKTDLDISQQISKNGVCYR